MSRELLRRSLAIRPVGPPRPRPSSDAAAPPGPEGAGQSLFRFEGAATRGFFVVVPPAPRQHDASGRPAPPFENCRASTSIKERSEELLPSYEEPTVDALAPDADEGRGWLRKATGSCRPSFDPWISEWGNQAGVMPSHC